MSKKITVAVLVAAFAVLLIPNVALADTVNVGNGE